MISAKQLKKLLDYSFTTPTSSGAVPTATFGANPNMYGITGLPTSVSLTGVITPNGATNLIWFISDPSGPLNNGSGTDVSHTLSGAAIPSVSGSTTYTLNVSYSNGTGAGFNVSFPTSITVTGVVKVGQLTDPEANITAAADLTNSIEDTLASLEITQVINLFPVIATNPGRILMVIPNSFGTVSSIQDNLDVVITSEFNLIEDNTNSRKIYITKNVLTPATYRYKFTF